MNFKTLYDARCMKLKMKTVFIVIVICVHSIASSSEVLNRSLRSVDDCGVPKIKTGLIVQGQSFPRGSYPWIVALMHQGFKPPRFFCGGTLISNVFVISGIFSSFSNLVSNLFLNPNFSSCSLHSSEA